MYGDHGRLLSFFCFYFFFNDTATTEIYTLSLHDALPICIYDCIDAKENAERCRVATQHRESDARQQLRDRQFLPGARAADRARSEEHTSELQSRQYLVCRLLLEKKKQHPTQAQTCLAL